MKLKVCSVTISLGLIGILSWQAAAENGPPFRDLLNDLTKDQLNHIKPGKENTPSAGNPLADLPQDLLDRIDLSKLKSPSAGNPLADLPQDLPDSVDLSKEQSPSAEDSQAELSNGPSDRIDPDKEKSPSAEDSRADLSQDLSDGVDPSKEKSPSAGNSLADLPQDLPDRVDPSKDKSPSAEDSQADLSQDLSDGVDPSKEKSPSAEDSQAESRRQTHIGDALPDTDLRAFKEAKDIFGEIESIQDGLGPTFNERGCGSCHTTPVVGGSGKQIERRFGRVEDGVFLAFDTDEDNQGGTLRQLFSLGTYDNGSMECTIPVEKTPSNANIRNVGRRTQPLFGLGLVDAMPNAFFDRLADAQPASVRGIVNRVPVVLPDPRDPSQHIGSMRVGRFGWKGLIPSLLVFSGDAYDNEMGITTQSCFDGVSILEFAEENFPNNVPPPEGCNWGDLAPLQPDHPDVPVYTDDAVGPCDGGRTEIQDDLVLFTTFVELLAPPPRDFSDPESIQRGEPLFTQIGCAHCHVTTTFVTPRRPFNGVPGNFAFNPYSDFLAHDMGSLGDRIGETGHSESQTRLMRTQPLWGARFNESFLHDGRAGNIQEAIQAHDGQGAAARDAFDALDSADQQALIEFVRSL